MRFRGFDRDFWIALAITVPTLIGLFLFSGAVAGWTGINRIPILLVLAGGAWLALHLFETRLRKSAGTEEEPVFCEWDSRIDGVTFAANEEMTRLSLRSHGLDIRSAVGMNFVCTTECGDDGKDYYFEGEFVRSKDGEIVVRAIHPEQLPASG